MSNSGRKKWIAQKYSSIALIPLIAYFLLKILQLSSMNYEQIITETGTIWFLVLVLIFTIIGLFHMRLGLHEIIEDYVQNEIMKNISTQDDMTENDLNFLCPGVKNSLYVSYRMGFSVTNCTPEP